MLFEDFDSETEPIVKLENIYGEPKHIVDKCIVLYSKVIHEYLLDHYDCTEIAEVSACNGNTKIYAFSYNGEQIAFYLSGTTATLAAENLREVNWLTGATKFVMFGSCGNLDKEKNRGKYIVPTESYRGEACSFYYMEPSDYIRIKNADKVSAIFDEIGAPYIKGRVWTTGSILRETVGLVQKRKSEGCLAVEMELAAVEAVCDFHGLELYNFLEAGDVLEESDWDIKDLSAANHDFGKVMIALEILKRI